MRPLRLVNVWHVGAWNRNVGDWALAYQMHRLLNEQARPRGLALTFHMVDSQRTFFHPALVDQMNDEAQLVLVGGGGLIFSRPEDQSVSGWSFNIPLADLDRVQPPVVVYAVGHNRFAFDPEGFPRVTGVHLRRLQDKAALFSVRNTGTRRRLVEDFGLDDAGISVIPDPGIMLYDRPIGIPPLGARRPVIALNWAGDRPHLRYPSPAEDNARHFAAQVKAALLQCVDSLGARIMVVPHLVGIDSDMVAEFVEGFPEGAVFSTHAALPFLYPPPGEMLYPHIPFFTNIYRQADLVIGMRLHACVLAFGAGTKFMRLGSHPKLRYFVEDLGVPDHGIPLVDRDAETAPALAARVQRCLADDVYARQLRLALDRQLATLRAFNERVLDLVK